MVLPQPFTTATPTIASFSFTELLSNQGYLTFYPMNVRNPARTYVLNSILTKTTDTFSTAVQDATLTFESSKADATRTIEGKAFIEYSMAVNDTAVGAASAEWTFELFKVSGATPTSLGSVTGETIGHDSSNWGAYTTSVAYIEILKTPLNAGDFLRLVCTADVSSHNVDSLALFHDPTDTAETSPLVAASTIMKVNIPFRKPN